MYKQQIPQIGCLSHELVNHYATYIKVHTGKKTLQKETNTSVRNVAQSFMAHDNKNKTS